MLDAMRGLAALAVVFWHAQGEFSPLARPGSGYLAVDFFFCLSGLVIAQAYDAKLNGGLTVREFLLIRIIRLYPLFVAGTLVIPLLTWGLGLSFETNVPHLSLAVGFGLFMLPTPPLDSIVLYPLNVVCWSLLVELLVNVAYALALRKGWSRFNSAVLIASALLIVCLALLKHSLDLGISWTNGAGGLIRGIYGFAAGRLLYSAIKSTKVRLPTISGLIPAALLLLFLWIDPGPARTFYDILFVLLLGPVLVLMGAFAQPGILALVAPSLGLTSYAIYTLHWPLLLAFHKLGLRGAPWTGFGFLLGLVMFCGLADKIYDAPVRRCLGRLVSGGAVKIASA
jgi:peptidoglycan/LPS O-acetylase OafA/YrhL